MYHRLAAPYTSQQQPDPTKIRGETPQNNRPMINQFLSSARPLSHHQAMPQPIRSNPALTSPHYHMNASPKSAGDYKRREEKHRAQAAANREFSRGSSHKNGQSNSSTHHSHHQTSSVVPQAHLARVNASISAAAPMRKISTDPLLINGTPGRPEVTKFLFLILILRIWTFWQMNFQEWDVNKVNIIHSIVI